MSSPRPPSTTLPSIGKPVAGWRSASSLHRVGRPNKKRQEKAGLWSAVALQQHATTTGGWRGAPLPALEASTPLGEQRGSRSSAAASAELGSAGEDGAIVHDDLRTHLGPATSLAAHPHKPTLAQRLGLVPAPPPEPSAQDWRVVVHRAILREQLAGTQHHSSAAAAATAVPSASCCSICLMSFLSTSAEGQIILSCSHVFHAQCFRAFERCVRAQQRADGAGLAVVTAQLACPVCRTQHYHKRVFYEGKAVVQRAAVVKLQAVARGYLARRAYVQRRLKANPQFRTRYVQERLVHLSSAWTAFCAQQDRRREETLARLAVQHQAATAAYMTEEKWRQLWQKVVASCSTGTCAENTTTTPPSVVLLQCPICLEGISESHFSQQACSNAVEAPTTTGEDAVAALCVAYEERRRQSQRAAVRSEERRVQEEKRKQQQQKPSTRKLSVTRAAPSVPTRPVAEQKRKTNRQSRAPPQSQAERQAPSSTNAVRQPLSPAAPSTDISSASTVAAHPVSEVGGHSGVLLSCGHYFHVACIGCYERYNAVGEASAALAGDAGSPSRAVVDRCPICRSGYAKHPL